MIIYFIAISPLIRVCVCVCVYRGKDRKNVFPIKFHIKCVNNVICHINWLMYGKMRQNLKKKEFGWTEPKVNRENWNSKSRASRSKCQFLRIRDRFQNWGHSVKSSELVWDMNRGHRIWELGREGKTAETTGQIIRKQTRSYPIMDQQGGDLQH